MKTATESLEISARIESAYEKILEATQEKPKFKVGAKVGIGEYTGDGQYLPHGSGVVSKHSKNNDHEVTHDTYQRTDDSGKVVPLSIRFNASGYCVHNPSQIVDIDTHVSNIKDNEEHQVRKDDLNGVVNGLLNRRNQLGKYQPLEKSFVEHLKNVLDKHIEK